MRLLSDQEKDITEIYLNKQLGKAFSKFELMVNYKKLFGMKLDRFKTHDIEIVIDKIIIKKENKKRLKESIKTAMKHGNGLMMTLDIDTGEKDFLV